MRRGHDGSFPHLHDGVLRYLDEGDVLHWPPEQVAEDAPEDGLVRHDDHAALLPAVLELRQHREDAAAAVHVGLACELNEEAGEDEEVFIGGNYIYFGKFLGAKKYIRNFQGHQRRRGKVTYTEKFKKKTIR